jgi:glycosyltransferase involved in cell wall biosynthesis
MKLLQINSNDTFGNRFNGIAIRDLLRERGIESKHLVWRRWSDDPDVKQAFDSRLSQQMARVLAKAENLLSLQSWLHLQWLLLTGSEEFRAADVVHYQIIHDGFFSLAALPRLTRRKPSVWTLHDPWAMTGHCLYPLDCTRWQSGCGSCPRLDLPFPLRRDRTAMNFRFKNAVYRRMDMNIVLASRWMMDFAARSPLMKGFRLNHIPFGVDLERFAPRSPEAARNRFGILPGHKVMALRAADGPYKGLEQFKHALRLLDTAQPICVLTTSTYGPLDEFIGRHQIVELGWTSDDETLADHYAAADFFVMPSTAEAFGLMAVEAMACGKPVLSFEGTSLPEVTFAPDAGLAVPLGDEPALAAALKRWIEAPEEVAERGRRSRRYAEEHYDIRLHADRMARLYQDVIARRSDERLVA